MKRHAPATARNRQPILDVLQQHLPAEHLPRGLGDQPQDRQRGLLQDFLGLSGPLQPPVEVPGPNARPAGPLGALSGRLPVHDRDRLGVSALPLEGLGQDPHRGRATPGVHRGTG